MPKFFDRVVTEIVATCVVAEIVGTQLVAQTYPVVYSIKNTEFMIYEYWYMLFTRVLRHVCVIT